MTSGPVGALYLSDFENRQFFYDRRREEQRRQKARDYGRARAESDILEQI
jgi:hypothetical protein